MVRGEEKSDGEQGCGECSERVDRLRQDRGWRGVRRDREVEQRDDTVADGAVDGFDVDEVAGDWINVAAAGDLEFVVAIKAGDAGVACEAVHAAGI
jgi:hypothetical protein